jgi:hypothetical protein
MRPGQPIVLVCDPGLELEAAVRLGRIGFDRAVGHLADPLPTFADHPELTEHSLRLSAPDLARLLTEPVDTVVVDVRNPGELAAGMIPGAVHLRSPACSNTSTTSTPIAQWCSCRGLPLVHRGQCPERRRAPRCVRSLGGYEAWRQLVR